MEVVRPRWKLVLLFKWIPQSDQIAENPNSARPWFIINSSPLAMFSTAGSQAYFSACPLAMPA